MDKGETNLSVLLRNMSPVIREGSFVFCSFKNAGYGDYAHLDPVGSFIEEEGLTLIISESAAIRERVTFEGSFKCISLQVHSSLKAVGLTAAVSEKLASKSISANIVAGYYHDHVFVPEEVAERALRLLQEF